MKPEKRALQVKWVGMHLVSLRSSKEASVAGEGWTKGTRAGEEGKEVMLGQILWGSVGLGRTLPFSQSDMGNTRGF